MFSNQARRFDSLSWFSARMLLALYPLLPQFVYIANGINILNLTSIALFGVMLLGIKDIKWRLPVFLVPYFIFNLFYSIYCCIEMDYFRALQYFLNYCLIPLALISQIDSKERFLVGIDTLIRVSFFIGLFGLFESFTQVNIFQLLGTSQTPFFHEIRYGLLRIMTTFGQPISYGLFQVFNAALILYRLSIKASTEDGHAVGYLVFAFIISTVNVFLTVSRIPVIAWMVVALVFLRKGLRLTRVQFTIISAFISMLICLLFFMAGVSIPFVSDLIAAIGNSLGFSSNSFSGPGIGNRLDLWYWVADSMNDSWIIGKGTLVEFSYEVHPWQIKTSIENQYLSTLFHTGLIGLLLLLLSYFVILFKTHQSASRFRALSFETRFSFSFVVFTVLFIYFICELGVQESDMARTYAVWLVLFSSYWRLQLLENGAHGR